MNAGLDALENTAMGLFCLNRDGAGIAGLLKKGARFDTPNKLGRCPIHNLVQVDIDGECTKWLLEIKDIEECFDIDA